MAEQNTKAFLAWLHQNGFKISPKCSLTDLRGRGRGRGLIASTGDFEEDEIIFRIPRHAMLSLQNATHDALNIPATIFEDMPAWLSLTVVMMAEAQRKNSRWSPYFAVLPSKIDSLVFWSPSELAELQASAVINKIGKSDAEDTFRQKVQPFGLVNGNMELFHKMASTIMAYAFDIPQQDSVSDLESEKDMELADDGGPKTILTMVPLADMLNADAQWNNARLVYDNDDLEMRSIKKIKRGEEIFNDYGSLPRSDLLRRYGYITDNYAPYDVVEMSTSSIIDSFQMGILLDDGACPLRLEPADLEVRLELARRGDIYEDSYDIAHASSEGPCIPDELLGVIYLLAIDEETLASILNSLSTMPSRSKMTTELLGRVMGNLLRKREREYATTLEEDDVLLNAGVSSHRVGMAVTVRRGEKAVLRAAMTEAASFQGDNKRMRWTWLNENLLKERLIH